MIRVLLVDDMRTVREVINHALEAVDSAMRVHAVPGAASALHVLRTGTPFAPDVLLLDLRLAAGDKPGGLALLPLIQVPVILFTAMSPDDVPPSVLLRCAAHVMKGAPVNEIASTIRRVLTMPA